MERSPSVDRELVRMALALERWKGRFRFRAVLILLVFTILALMAGALCAISARPITIVKASPLLKLEQGDVVLARRASTYGYGDIVTAETEEVGFTGKVIATVGDWVYTDSKNGEILVNGKVAVEGISYQGVSELIQIPPNFVYIYDDVKVPGASVSVSSIFGRLWFSIFPLNRLRIL